MIGAPVANKLDRATAALRCGHRYQMDGVTYEFHTTDCRAVLDMEPLSSFAGALWPLTKTEEPAFMVCWNGGRVEEVVPGALVGTGYRSLHVLHETRHAGRAYLQSWDRCDGSACGMIDL